MNNFFESLEPYLPKGFLADAFCQSIGGTEPTVEMERVSPNCVHASLHYILPNTVSQDDFQCRLICGFPVHRHWTTYLTPMEQHIAAQHIFRSPAMLMVGQQQTFALVPDLDLINGSPVPWYMDLDAAQETFCLGMSLNAREGHVFYTRTPGAVYPAGTLTFGFYLFHFSQALDNPFAPLTSFFWEKWGRVLYLQGAPQSNPMELYVKHTYEWAFQRWKNAVWQSFQLDGALVGAPAFIVVAQQSPNYPATASLRETLSIWNQAWFCSLRSASGLYRYAKRTQNAALLAYANQTKELALHFPQENGLFDSVIATEMETYQEDGVEKRRSLGWETRYFGNSDRNPFVRNLKQAPRHLLDMSFTAYYMLLWHTELETDSRLLDYVTRYAKRLISLQQASGYFPAWIDKQGKTLEVLDQSAESSMSAAFLLALYKKTHTEEYRRSALRALHAIQKDLIVNGCWEDFECYWSCAPFHQEACGKKVPRNDTYKSTSLGMYYTALAYYEAYECDGDPNHLQIGKRVLDEMLMLQACWQPAYLPVPVFGGFGVMNADAEWLDSRQSLFAELIYQYGIALNDDQYCQRAISALRASFVMMYCPENPEIKKLWEAVWPFFNETDYGFCMENYGHDGFVDTIHHGIGVFTIYDWGNGAAAEAYERMRMRYGLSDAW